MSLGEVKNSHYEYEIIVKALKDKEKTGVKEISVKMERSRDWNECIGQILYWNAKSSTYPFKKIWVIAGYDREKMEVLVKYHSDTYDPQSVLGSTLSHRDIQKISDEEFYGKLVPGTLVIQTEKYSSPSYGRITEVKSQKVRNKNKSFDNKFKNPHREYVDDEEIVVILEKEETGKRYNQLKKFVSKDVEVTYAQFKNWAIIHEASIEEFEEIVNKSIETNQLVGFSDTKMLTGAAQESQNGLIGFNSVDVLKKQQNQMELQSQKATSLMAGIRRSTMLMKEDMDRRLAEINEKTSLVLSEANRIVTIIDREVKKVMTLVVTLEIYAGIHEEMKQIKEGKPADPSVPVSIRQQTLYMDEEICILDDDGLDFQDLDKFDEWLASDKKIYGKLIPEEKGIVLMRPRRYMKDRSYLNNIRLEREMEMADRACYIFIRNGENLYRIWTDHVETQDIIFPDRKDIEQFFEEVEKLNVKLERAEENDNTYEADRIVEQLSEKEKSIFYYKRIMILLQGLMTRTNVFQPVPHDLNLLDESTYKNRVNFIYDGDANVIESGRDSYGKWKDKLNGSIVKGSRIIYVDEIAGNANDYPNRFSLQWYHDHSAPPMPNTGIYSVKEDSEEITKEVTKWVTEKEFQKAVENWEKIKEKHKKFYTDGSLREKHYYDIPKEEYEKHMPYNLNWNRGREGKYEVKLIEKFVACSSTIHDVSDDEFNKGRISYTSYDVEVKKEKKTVPYFKISYQPKREVYARRQAFEDGSWVKDGTGFITFRIRKDDEFVINYDALVIEDIEYYLQDRVNRKNYLKMMPILKELKQNLIKEHNEEKEFVKAIHTELKSSYPELKTMKEEEVWKCVAWWKDELVTVWKRPISKNNTKAWNQIRKQLLIQNGILNMYSPRVFHYKETGSPAMYWYGKVKKDFVDAVKEFRTVKASKKTIGDNTSEIYSGDMYDMLKSRPNELVLQ